MEPVLPLYVYLSDLIMVLKLYLNNSERCRDRRHNLCRGDYNIRKDILALPFSRQEGLVRKPLPPNYPRELKNIGNHLRARRLNLNLLQSDVAKLLKVTTDCITLWETDQAKPQVHFVPEIIKFLGYNPYTFDTNTIGGQVKKYRFEHGLCLEGLGKLLNVDASTVSSWENNKRLQNPMNNESLNKLLGKGITIATHPHKKRRDHPK